MIPSGPEFPSEQFDSDLFRLGIFLKEAFVFLPKPLELSGVAISGAARGWFGCGTGALVERATVRREPACTAPELLQDLKDQNKEYSARPPQQYTGCHPPQTSWVMLSYER